jgi:predicted kinase
MRKWMRERLQRRKKTDEPSKPAPPPLQPAYFDADGKKEAAAESPRDAAEPEIASSPAADASYDDEPRETADASEERPRSNESAPTSSSETQASANPSRPPRDSSQRRGRRRRGGRGRGGSGREQAVAQAFAPAGAKGSPAAPFESGEEVPATDGEAPALETPNTPVVSPVAQRPPKGLVVLAIGLPGSGKSTWFKRHDIVPLSSDVVRSLLFDDVREQRFQDLVFSNLRSMLKARLIAKRPTNYVDATNLTPQERQHWIKLAKDYGYEVQAVFFDVPLEVCLDRHHRRDRVVPEDVMRRMAAKLKAPSFGEGFSKITVVRVKKKEADTGKEPG